MSKILNTSPLVICLLSLIGCGNVLYVSYEDLPVKSMETSGNVLHVTTTVGDYFYADVKKVAVIVGDKTDGVYVNINNANRKYLPGPPVGFARSITFKVPNEEQKSLWEKRFGEVTKPCNIALR